MTQPNQPPDPGVPQTPKPKQITGEKLCSTKNALNFSWAAPGPVAKLINYIYKTIIYFLRVLTLSNTSFSFLAID